MVIKRVDKSITYEILFARIYWELASQYSFEKTFTEAS